MPERLAHFISWIFQPLLIPLAGTLIYLLLPFYQFTMMHEKMRMLLVVSNLMFTVVFPGVFILLMRSFKLIESISLDERKDRPIPLFLTAIFYGFNFYYLSRLGDHLPWVYYYFMLGGIASVLITLLVSGWWKISIHMTGMGGLCGTLLLAADVWAIDLRLLLAVVFLVAGLTGTARLRLNAHTPAQLGAGFLAGFFPQVAPILFT